MLYSGICEGGPYHGKSIYHGLPIFKVAMQGSKVVTWFGGSTPQIVVNRYRHQDGRWVWEE